jgi:hypothetical protein
MCLDLTDRESDSVRRFGGTQRNRIPRLLGIALAITLLGITTATAAHEHVRGAEYSQNCTICAVAKVPQQAGEAVELPELCHPVEVALQVVARITPPSRRPSHSRLSRAPPA